jgi:hypothetical protein
LEERVEIERNFENLITVSNKLDTESTVEFATTAFDRFKFEIPRYSLVRYISSYGVLLTRKDA